MLKLGIILVIAFNVVVASFLWSKSKMLATTNKCDENNTILALEKIKYIEKKKIYQFIDVNTNKKFYIIDMTDTTLSFKDTVHLIK